MEINPTKTELVMFIRQCKRPAVEPISLGGTVIPFADSAKDLCGLLDKRLFFELNILE